MLLIGFGKLTAWPAIVASVQDPYTGHCDSTPAKAGVPVSFRQHCHDCDSEALPLKRDQNFYAEG